MRTGVPGHGRGSRRRGRARFRVAGCFAAALLLVAAAGRAADAVQPDLAARVVVLANSRQPESLALAARYIEARGIPSGNIVALPLPEAESITWREFVDHVHQPLQDELVRRQWIDAVQSELLDAFGRRRAAVHGHRISFLVVCRGVPLRIHHDPTVQEPRVRLPGPQFRTNQASVDAELALLAWPEPPGLGFVPNPLFGRDDPTGMELRQVVRVSRLDGPSWEDAWRLVAGAIAAETSGLAGRYYIDLRGPHADGDRWLGEARRLLDEAGFEGDTEETGGTFPVDARFDAPAWYFGWYTGSFDGPFQRADFRFPAGAVAVHIHSFSAATLRSRESGWSGPLVARGATATVGNVFEPYLQLTHRPDLLARALLRGRTWGEAAAAALPVLGWQAIALGDPLYRPFGQGGAEPANAGYTAIRAARLREREGDAAGAVAVLRAATDRAPTLPLLLALSRLYERTGERSRAIGALELARPLRDYRGGDWPLGREIARSLVRLGAYAAALDIYTVLADSPAPTPAAARGILAEARAAADRAGDLARSVEFARRSNEAASR